jgi:hypothetical protein
MGATKNSEFIPENLAQTTVRGTSFFHGCLPWFSASSSTYPSKNALSPYPFAIFLKGPRSSPSVVIPGLHQRTNKFSRSQNANGRSVRPENIRGMENAKAPGWSEEAGEGERHNTTLVGGVRGIGEFRHFSLFRV